MDDSESEEKKEEVREVSPYRWSDEEIMNEDPADKAKRLRREARERDRSDWDSSYYTSSDEEDAKKKKEEEEKENDKDGSEEYKKEVEEDDAAVEERARVLADKNAEMVKEKHPEHRDFRLDRVTVDHEEAERREKARKEKERRSRDLPPPATRIYGSDWEFPTEDLIVFGET